MARTDLGTRDVSLPYQWVGFEPISLKTGSMYVLYCQVQSGSMPEVYSTFSFRLRGKIDKGLVGVSPPLALVEAVTEMQTVGLVVAEYWSEKTPIIIECRRNIFYRNQSNLANASMQLQLDPKEEYEL